MSSRLSSHMSFYREMRNMSMLFLLKQTLFDMTFIVLVQFVKLVQEDFRVTF